MKNGRMPLLIYGARQVGKTFEMQEFGALYYKNTVYVNFETDEKIVFQKKTRVCLCIEMIIAIIAVTIGYCGISRAVMLAHIVEGILATMGLAFRNGNEEVNY